MAIARAIIPVIEAAGGRVLVGARVKSVAIEADAGGGGGERAVGVVMEDGTFIPASFVVSGTGFIHTFTKLVALSPEQQRRLQLDVQGVLSHLGPGPRSDTQSVAYVFLFVGLKGSVSQLALPSSNLWVWPHNDFSLMLKDYFDAPLSAPMPLFIAFGSSKDLAWERAHPQHSTAIVLTFARYEWFEKWADQPCERRDAEYQAFKAKFGERLLHEGLLRHFPHLASAVDYTEVASPVTYNHYFDTGRGECYGLNVTARRFTQFGHRELHPRTPVNGLYLTGQDVCSLGFTGALMSSLFSASAVLGLPKMASMLVPPLLFGDCAERVSSTKK